MGYGKPIGDWDKLELARMPLCATSGFRAGIDFADRENSEMVNNPEENRVDGGPVVVRFAPSPNGYLHLGHAYSAVLNSRFAAGRGGRFLLRLEDIDLTRARPQFEQAIYDDLSWLNLVWEMPVRRQSQHLAFYRQVLDQLDGMGLLYRCFCSRLEIRSAATARGTMRCDPDGAPVYPGTCRGISEAESLRLRASGKPFALRLDMERALQSPVMLRTKKLWWEEFGEGDECSNVAADVSAWGDVVLGRKDTGTSYHIAVVADDQLQGVTDIIRGEDLYAATSIHRLLQALLNFSTPRYRHHTLIMDESGTKYSKSAESASLRSLRADGCTFEDVLRLLPLPARTS